MELNATQVWGVHAGKTGDADRLFLDKGCDALGWDNVGDFSSIPKDREAFKEAVRKAYPDTKPGAVPTNAGQLFRFVHEMHNGDYVIYPSKHDRQVHVGTVIGAYSFSSTRSMGYPNRRPVKWLGSFPRTQFSQGALYEIGSVMSFFQVRNHADDFVKAASGETAVPVDEGEDNAAPVAENIEEITQDWILKKLATDLKGHPFADFVAHLLMSMGYKTRVSPEGPDGGIDIIAHRDELGFDPPIVKVQVKSSEGSIGDPVVSALYGKVSAGEFGLPVTLGSFTSQAKAFGRSKSNLRLIDGAELVSLILSHYDELASQYKGMIPLRKIFVPQPIGDDAEGF